MAAALSIIAASAAAESLAGKGYGIDEAGGRPAGAKLVWADEFDKPGAPDPKKWAFDTSRNKLGWYNNELQYYAADRPQNVRVENGSLVIEARSDDLGPNKPADWGGQRYTSGKIQTLGLAAWTYGFVEVRAKLACGRGTWPAIWMMPATNERPWPDGGEIDIMEHVGWDEGVVHGTLHTRDYNHTKQTGRGGSAKLAQVCGDFHRYQLQWTPTEILIGADDRNYLRVKNDKPGDIGAWPFDRPFYLILNLAVGGWGGEKGIDEAAFPARFEVDYARVYSLKP